MIIHVSRAEEAIIQALCGYGSWNFAGRRWDITVITTQHQAINVEGHRNTGKMLPAGKSTSSILRAKQTTPSDDVCILSGKGPGNAEQKKFNLHILIAFRLSISFPLSLLTLLICVRSIMNPKSPNLLPEACRSLFLGDLSCFCQENEIYDIFSQFGPIDEIRIKRNEEGLGLGYGFVTFLEMKSAEAALLGADGMVILGRPVK